MIKPRQYPFPLLGVVVGLGLGSTNADAGHRSFGDGLPDYLAQFDTSGDGRIDEEERQAIKAAREAAHAEFVALWDTDGIPGLSDEEKEAAREAIRAEIAAKRAAEFAEIAGEDLLLTLEEFSAIESLAEVEAERVAAIFDRMDSDDSGDVTLEEFNARLRHHRSSRRDHDGHGGLTDEERAAREEAARLAVFNGIAGDDGSISLEDLEAALPNLDPARLAELAAAAEADDLEGLSFEEFSALDYGDLAREDRELAREAERAAAREAIRLARFAELAGEVDPHSITLEEFAASLPDVDQAEVEALFAAMDIDPADGVVTLNEFTYDDDHHKPGANRHRSSRRFSRSFSRRR